MMLVGCGCAGQSRESSGAKNDPARPLEGAHLVQWGNTLESGISYYKSNQYDNAISKLIQAFRINSSDQKTLLFLGLSYESAHDYSKAAVIYRYLATLSPLAEVRDELRARLEENQHKGWQASIRKRMMQDTDREAAAPNTVAVLYFRNLSSWRELDPIIKGLAEIITDDLSKVGTVTLTDRKQVQILVDELNTSPSELYDKLKMTEIGRILGVNFLVTGGIERLSDTRISVSAGVVDARTGDLIGSGSRVTAQLSEIVATEKQIVLDVIRDLDLQLSEAQRNALLILPTQSSLAFIAFGKALSFADLDMPQAAEEQYAKALRIDAGFKLARRYSGQRNTKRLSDAQLERILSPPN